MIMTCVKMWLSDFYISHLFDLFQNTFNHKNTYFKKALRNNSRLFTFK